MNRIDSRARGNAPQMLEKYRKLAQDAHLNGDRVSAEYYLQFADHYFRVIADTRVRQEESRLRRDDRWQEGGEGAREEGDDSNDFSVESDFPAFDQPPVYTRREREDRPRDERPRDERPRQDRPREDRARDEWTRDEPQRDEAAAPDVAPASDVEAANGVDNGEPRSIYEPVENPFVRDNRGVRGGLRARRESPRGTAPRNEDRRPRRDDGLVIAGAQPNGDSVAAAPQNEAPATFDPASLPPSISVAARIADDAEAPVKPRRRARRKPTDEPGDGLESVA